MDTWNERFSEDDGEILDQPSPKDMAVFVLAFLRAGARDQNTPHSINVTSPTCKDIAKVFREAGKLETMFPEYGVVTNKEGKGKEKENGTTITPHNTDETTDNEELDYERLKEILWSTHAKMYKGKDPALLTELYKQAHFTDDKIIPMISMHNGK